jgi:hypothetical protein
MKTYIHLWYLAQFFLKWEMFQTKVVGKIKTHILCSITFSRKSCSLWNSVEKYGTTRQATGDNIVRRMRFAFRITKATDTYSEYVALIAFQRQNGYANAPQCYVIVNCFPCFNIVSWDSQRNREILMVVKVNLIAVLLVSSTLTMEVPHFPEILWSVCQTTWHHIPDTVIIGQACVFYTVSFSVLASGTLVWRRQTFRTNLLAPYLGKQAYTEDGISRLFQNNAGVAVNQKVTTKSSTALKNPNFNSCGR